MAHEQPKWEGKARTKLTGPTADEVWPLLEDFFTLNKWFPTLATCRQVEGISGQPGCVRYCAGFKTPYDNGDGETTNWTKQKLLAIDPIMKTYSYSIIDSNVKFYSYVSTVKVLPWENDGQEGCEIEWSFEVDPVEGWTFENVFSFIDNGLQVMGKRMEEALRPSK